jgi:hypothetical protein
MGGQHHALITDTVKLHQLRWFGHIRRLEEINIPRRVLYLNLETIRLRGRLRHRWQYEVREDGRMVGGEECLEKVYNREEWKKVLKTAKELMNTDVTTYMVLQTSEK